jgi:DNA-binding MarR family transcriptional regulator
VVRDVLVDTLLELMRVIRRRTHPVRRGEMTPEQYGLLRRLDACGPLSVGDLAGRLGVSPSAATMACQRLERQGLVSRVRSPEDERVVRVTLTPEGRQRVAQWRAARRELVAGLVEVLAPEEQVALTRLLRRILDHVEVTPGDAAR